MMTMKQKLAGAVLLLMALAGLRDNAHAQRDGGRGPARAEVRGILKSADAVKGTITVVGAGTRDAPAEEKTYTLAKNAEVAIASAASGGRGGRGGLAREGKLADLAPGATVSLTLSADAKTVDSILAEGPMVRGVLKSVDGPKNTLTIAMAPTRREEAGEERTYAVDPNAEIAVDDGRGRRFSVKEAKLTDVASGSVVTLWVSVDQKHVQSVLAEGPNLYGVAKSIDAAKSTLTITSPQRGGEAEEKIFEVAKNAMILLDDGKGRRLSLKEGKLADVPVGSAIMVKLSADQKSVSTLRAEGPSANGRLKSIDAGKGTITVEIFVARGENPEEKTYTFAKDVRVTIDGKEGKLADIKVEDGTFAQVRLSLDQKTVQAIMIGRPRGRE